MMQPLTAVLQLKTGHDYEVYSLDSSGQRKNRVVVEQTAVGKCRVEITAENKSMFYEFVKTGDNVTKSIKSRPDRSADIQN